MRKMIVLFVLAMLLSVLFGTIGVQAAPSDNSCWGQATAVFAGMGEMGEHSSQQATPRVGLRNLARALYDGGVIADDSMQALGVFVATTLELNIDACMD
jgi:hypothetical protein